MGGRGRAGLLLSSSVAALLIGGGAPAAFAACANGAGSGSGFDNPAAATTPCVAVTNTNFSGSITNEGTIAPGGVTFTNGTMSGFLASSGNILGGLALDNNSTINNAVGTAVSLTSSTFLGGISNAGLISAADRAVVISGVTTFGGGIGNTGTISAGGTAISVSDVSAFSGGIVNQGSLGGSVGIQLTGCGCLSFSTFSGGISNSGTISASGFGGGIGIAINNVATFLDGIHNTGLIAGNGGLGAGFGIAIGQFGPVGSFSGGIDNGTTGTITASPGAFGGTPIGILVANVSAFSGDITNRGLVSVPSGVGIAVLGVDTFAGRIANSGTITAGFAGIAVGSPFSTPIGSFGGGISNSGLIAVQNSGVGIGVQSVSLFTGGISNSGTITGTGAGAGIDICGCVQTFSGGITNSGRITAGSTGIAVSAGSFDGHIANSGTISAAINAINLTAAGNAITIDQTAGLIQGDILFSPNGDTLNVMGGTINGNVVGQGLGGTVNFELGNGAFTYAGGLAMTGLSAANFLSGTAFIDGEIDAGLIGVNNGGTAAGTGTLAGVVTVAAGGTLMPGDTGSPLGTLTVTGSLAFNAGSFYAVHIAPGAGNTSMTTVTGAVTIAGGTVLVTPQFGHYNATTYTIINSTGPVTGAFATTPVFTGPLAFSGSATVSSGANEVDLNLGAGSVIFATTGLNQNQQNVVNGINNAILAGANLPPQFTNLANLSRPAFANAITQLSGENAAGFFQGAFQAGNAFLNLMVNPFLDGRFGSGGGFGAAMGFAAEEPPALPQAAAAFASAMPVKATPVPAMFAPHYSVWGAAYGGSGRVAGDPLVGSHDTSASAAAFAAGIDYRVSPTTVFGIALAGGGTNWDLTGGLGGGRSDMFQAGAYGSHHWGAAYVSGALAYNFHDVTTDRTVTIAGVDKLEARFQANGIGARLEGGYRYATPWLGITPYAATQVQSIALPNYGETATAGSNQFALTFASQTATTTRTELGAWLDKSARLDSGALLTLYGRAAWAHDFGNSPSASAIFQALPGSNFVVNSAVPARDGALVTGAAQVSLANGWSFLAKFDGEFSSTTSIYSGSGMVKKTW